MEVAGQYKYASNRNVDEIRINGVYRCSDNTDGTPTGYRYGFLHVAGDPNWFTSQIFISADNKMFFRSKATEWSDWKEL